MKLCTKFQRYRAIRGGVIAISIFGLVTLNMCCVRRCELNSIESLCFQRNGVNLVQNFRYKGHPPPTILFVGKLGWLFFIWYKNVCCAPLWGKFQQVWLSITYPCLNYCVFLCWCAMSCCDLDLWPVDLESSFYIKCRVIKVCTKVERNWAIPDWIVDNFAYFAHVMSRHDFDFWPLDLELLQHFGCHAFKLCTKFERNRMIHSWVIEDVLPCNFMEWGRTNRAFSGVHRPNFTKLGEDIGRSSEHCTLVSEFGYLAAFSNAGGSHLSDVKNDAQFSTFWPPVKIRGGVGEISIPIIEAVPTTEPPNYVWWPSTARLLSAVDW